MASATYLDRILAAHRQRAQGDRRALADLVRQAERHTEGDPPRGFRVALLAEPALSVIAEIKRRSPSKGPLNPDLDPAELAHVYAAGGATCLSVLTDADFFGGSTDDLVAARAACRLPVLRKDFTVDARDVADARLMGADCVLLIAAALDDGELAQLLGVAGDLGLDALVEVHDEVELARAVTAGATLIGVNQRDLVTFEVDHERAERVGALIPEGVVRVAESGVRGAEDAVRLQRAGFHAILVGESLVTAADPSQALHAMRTAS